MKRLTKRTANGNAYFINECYDDGEFDAVMIVEHLAELEDKLESGSTT